VPPHKTKLNRSKMEAGRRERECGYKGTPSFIQLSSLDNPIQVGSSGSNFEST